MPQEEKPLTLLEIAEKLGVTEGSARTAILALGMRDDAKRDKADRRRIVYPLGTLEKVNQWLDTH